MVGNGVSGGNIMESLNYLFCFCGWLYAAAAVGLGTFFGGRYLAKRQLQARPVSAMLIGVASGLGVFLLLVTAFVVFG